MWFNSTWAAWSGGGGKVSEREAFRLSPGVTRPAASLPLEKRLTMHWQAKDPASCYSHVLGVALSITGLMTLIVESHGDPRRVVGFFIYGASLSEGDPAGARSGPTGAEPGLAAGSQAIVWLHSVRTVEWAGTIPRLGLSRARTPRSTTVATRQEAAPSRLGQADARA